MSFNIGDVVVLNSGGLQMTIEESNGTYVECCWFDENNKLVRNSFNIRSVKLVSQQ